jgi:DNA-binding IclR family transcriptional regulator
VRALDWLFTRPVFQASELARTSDIPPGTANRILREVREAGLLKELREASGRRPAILAFSELPNIAERREVL